MCWQLWTSWGLAAPAPGALWWQSSELSPGAQKAFWFSSFSPKSSWPQCCSPWAVTFTGLGLYLCLRNSLLKAGLGCSAGLPQQREDTEKRKKKTHFSFPCCSLLRLLKVSCSKFHFLQACKRSETSQIPQISQWSHLQLCQIILSLTLMDVCRIPAWLGNQNNQFSLLCLLEFLWRVVLFIFFFFFFPYRILLLGCNVTFFFNICTIFSNCGWYPRAGSDPKFLCVHSEKPFLSHLSVLSSNI